MVEVAEFAMAEAQVAVDATAARGMSRIIGVREGKSLQHAKLRFDQVDPRSLRRGPHRRNAQVAQQG